MTARHALYFAPPPESPLAVLGARWLGRDAERGTPLDRPDVPGLPAGRLAALTSSPRLYGFHATLKAPFRLAPDATPDLLRARLAAFAAVRRPFDLRLELRSLHGFLALMEAEPSAELRDLADACVTGFDDLRAPMPPEERRRRSKGLDPRQAAHLDRWGYPYVLDTFRFHMTLSERLSEAEAAVVRRTLDPLAADACRDPVRVDAVALFVQPEAGADFTVAARFRFGG